MPVSNAANPRDNIVRLPGNHTLPTFQCKKGYGQFIKEVSNTDRNPQWLQSLREHRAIRLETKYERYTSVLDENDNLTVTAEKILLGYSIQEIWYRLTHSASFRGLFGHSAPDIRAAAIEVQLKEKYHHERFSHTPLNIRTAIIEKKTYHAVWDEWENNAPPGSEENYAEAVRRLKASLSTYYREQSKPLHERRPYLYSFLDLGNLDLPSLPPELPKYVEQLNVQNNQLREFTGLPDSLKKFFAYNNQLLSLPDPLPPGLLMLNVGNNQLRVLPPLPGSLEFLDASRNPLRTLPESITRLPRNAAITITSSSLSPQTLQTLQNLRTNPNYQGPRINFDMAGPVAKRPGRPLSDAVIAWFPVESTDSVAAQWASVNQEENAPAFSAFLDRLNDTVSAKKVTGFKEQVAAWLTKLQESPVLRALTFAISYDATETCEDRVALAYNSMQQAMLTHDIENGKYDKDLPGLFSVARELFRLEKLEEIAREKVKSLHFVDEIEVYLAFQVKLRHALVLTSVTEEMRFFGVSHVTADDLAIAEIQIKSAENSEFSGWLSQWAPWHCLLKRIEPALYEAADTKKYDVTESITSRIDAELKTLGLQNDARAAADSGKEITAAIREIDRELTTEVLLNRKLASLLSWQWEIDAPHRALSPGG